MAHKHSVYDTDAHFIVDPMSRAITTQSGKRKLMCGDHNSERFTFQAPRYIEGHDMSLCDSIEIHYTNLSTNKQYRSVGPYPVEDMQISPDGEEFIIFSWLISGNATMYAGTLSFSIHFKCLTDFSIDYAWSTDSYESIEIAATEVNDGAQVVYEYHDVLMAWKKHLTEAFKEAVRDVQENGVEQDYVLLADQTTGKVYKLYANDEKLTMEEVSE